MDHESWDWRLPILFLETKAAIGCRIGELSAALTCNLQKAVSISPPTRPRAGKRGPVCCRPTCTRNFRPCRADLRLRAFQRGVEGHLPSQGEPLRRERRQGVRPQTAETVDSGRRQGVLRCYQSPPLQAPQLPGTAMSKARLAGVSYDDAAVAFDCDPRVMQQHYAAFDKATLPTAFSGRFRTARTVGCRWGREWARTERCVCNGREGAMGRRVCNGRWGREWERRSRGDRRWGRGGVQVFADEKGLTPI